ncbi:diacylglycerol/lipid kinase family protein [Pedobacter metabolipauper]|uniref:YegS/Rv2252/BmrU family lipid kinase n=1 Tax=Pedobacter metabolipauper TaxID=425513 RepID=A0A4R6SXA3_9SPHI|nr:diacylglycerol kinase family protein [Pedobacter metabolipauper]TDQ09793.1 YegS/Rv2252/BmrU family lipid kinase [Pedobacter metabolipauper]
MSKSNILFIINPISGGKDKLKIPALIDANIDRSKFNPNFSFTEYIGHASEIAEEAANKNFDVIVAVGGDGTINEVAAKVMQYDKILGIIPFGSGNGLARFLKIPIKTAEAIKVINKFDVKVIDTATFNEKRFFNMAGMGFDAYISAVFAGNKSRGLAGYLKLGMKEVLSYRSQDYDLIIDGKEYTRNAFVISIANSSQYGNNAHIAPAASITDGLLDVCIIKKFPMYKLPVLAYQMLNATTDQSDLVEIIKGSSIKIVRSQNDAIHIDGEPFFMGKEIDIAILPLSLNIITP